MATTQRDLVLGLDVGTASCRALLVDRRGRIWGHGRRGLRRRVLPSGWIEQDAEQCWRGVRGAVRAALASAGLGPERVVAIGLATQRSTTLAFDRRTLRPLAPAISWQCQRTRELIEQLPDRRRRRRQQRSGLPVEPFFAASKMAWLAEKLARERRRLAGAWCVGTLDSWLVARLSQSREPVTDLSLAARTLLLDLGRREWSNDGLTLFDLDANWLPAIVPSIGEFAQLGRNALPPLPAGLPLAGLAGDQQAALFAGGCRRRGLGKVTYGSGAFLLVHAGSRIPAAGDPVQRSVAWSTARRIDYLLETNVPAAGTMIAWLTNLLGAPFAELLARGMRRDRWDRVLGQLTCVPAFAGLGPQHPGLPPGGRLDGLRHDSDGPQLAIALAAGIGAALADGLAACEHTLGGRVRRLIADGGGARDPRFVQIQADLLRRSLTAAREAEATAFGAAALAWQGIAGHAPVVAPGATRPPRLPARAAGQVRQHQAAALTALVRERARR